MVIYELSDKVSHLAIEIPIELEKAELIYLCVFMHAIGKFSMTEKGMELYFLKKHNLNKCQH